jgi:hypothetical protein
VIVGGGEYSAGTIAAAIRNAAFGERIDRGNVCEGIDSEQAEGGAIEGSAVSTEGGMASCLRY